MPLGAPTYENFTPQNGGNRRSGGGGRRSPRPTPTPAPIPLPGQPPRPERSGTPPTSRPENVADRRRRRSTPTPSPGRTAPRPPADAPWVHADPTGITPSYVPPGRQIQHQTNRALAEEAARDEILRQQTQRSLDVFNEFQSAEQDRLASRYAGDAASAAGRRDLNLSILEQGLDTDLGLLGEREFRDIDLEREGIAGRRSDLAQYMQILGAREGIRRDQYVTDRDYFNALNNLLGRERSLAYDRFQSNDSYLQRVAQDNLLQYGFANRDFEQRMGANRLQRDTSRRSATSDAAGRGAFGSAGFRDNLQTIMDQYGLSAEQAQLALDQANQSIGERDRSIGNERDNLRFGYDGQVIGFDRDAEGLTRSAATNYNNYREALQGFRRERVGLNAQGRELDLADRALDSLAREYGIKREDLNSQFRNNVTSLGLDYSDTIRQLNDWLASGNAQLAYQAQQFMDQIMVLQ